MRSILAQHEYTYQIKSWVEKGVPFDRYMYVPEVHPVSNMEFHEIEDEGHVFKASTAVKANGVVCL